MIRLESITKRFANGQVAVDALDLEVGEGEVCMLVGPSGCGKTTTLKMINRLIEPTSGRIFLDGDDVTTVDPVRLRRRIGYVIQQVGLFPHQSVAENVGTVPRLVGWDRRRARRRVDELLELVGLDPRVFRDRYPHQLSGGQRQRVGVARALAVDPPVLLMDEPFGAIDPIARDRLQQEFLRLQGEVKKTVVFVTHDIDEAVRLGDRIAILRQGGVLEQYASPAEVLGRPATPFVADFVGADRGLKRLSVTAIDAADLATLPTVTPGASLEDARRAMDRAGSQWAVVVEDGGRLAGALSRERAEGDGTAADAWTPVEASVPAGATLKDAFAELLLHDTGWVAVVGDGRFCGVLTPDALHAAIRRSAADTRPTSELGDQSG
ncbi:MAG TPA: betaine/proline/choline family ABC transporter ATP-binding protein [Acidimicrobiales bacterium]|nr:betaine/proline/choline family ABC transporter ATP-binding protein [Acidimicrobiales bacterium]